MPSFKKTAVHSVYLPKLDAEHENILRSMEELNRAVAEGRYAEQAHAALEDLAAKMSAHFAGEERMMRSCAYSSYEWHKRQHDTARKRLKEFTGRAESGESCAVGELVDFFKSWMKDHTGLHDRMMAAYLRNFERARVRPA